MGRYEVVKLLLQAGAEINLKNQEGFNALHTLIMARMLFLPRKNTVQEDKSFWSKVINKIVGLNSEVANDLEKEDSYFKCALLLVQYGVDIHQRTNKTDVPGLDIGKHLPLRMAAEYGFKDLVKLFLSVGIEKYMCQNILKNPSNEGFLCRNEGEIPKLLISFSHDNDLNENQKKQFIQVLYERKKLKQCDRPFQDNDFEEIIKNYCDLRLTYGN